MAYAWIYTTTDMDLAFFFSFLIMAYNGFCALA